MLNHFMKGMIIMKMSFGFKLCSPTKSISQSEALFTPKFLNWTNYIIPLKLNIESRQKRDCGSVES